MPSTKLIIISGPSGCGKTTIAHKILEKYPELMFSVSATTRSRRDSEINGKDYYFITKKEFEEKIHKNELIEWEQIYNDYYGSLKSEVEKAFSLEKSILFDVDVKGALSIKKKYPNHAVSIFIKPPSVDLLIERLKKRGTETKETLTKRIERVSMELQHIKDFDYCVTNDNLEDAVTKVDNIIAKFLLNSKLKEKV